MHFTLSLPLLLSNLVCFTLLGRTHPITLLNLIWLAFVTSFLFFKENFISVNLNTFLLIYLACGSSLFSACFVRVIFLNKSSKIDSGVVLVNQRLMFFLILLCFLAIPYVYYKISFTLNLAYLVDLKDKLTEGDGQLFGSLGRIGQSVMIVAFVAATSNLSRKLKILIFFIAFVINIPLMAKETFLLYVSAVFYYYYFYGRISIVTAFFKILIPVSFFMFFIMWMRFSEEMDFEFLILILNTYLLSPIAALDIFVQNVSPNWNSIETLRSFNLIMQNFGSNVNIPNIIKEFVFTPFATNVYTYLMPYYKDFGYFGVLIYSIIIGLFLSVLYEFSRIGSKRSLLLLSLMSFAIFFSFFTEKFFTWTTQWLIFYTIIWICTKKIRL